jgi:hypothetical protein
MRHLFLRHDRPALAEEAAEVALEVEVEEVAEEVVEAKAQAEAEVAVAEPHRQIENDHDLRQLCLRRKPPLVHRQRRKRIVAPVPATLGNESVLSPRRKRLRRRRGTEKLK